jgi:hypothetical protein
MHKKLKKTIAIICFIIVALILKIGIDKQAFLNQQYPALQNAHHF